MSEWFRNGQRADAIPADDRGFLYADGLFETIAIRDGKPRLWDLHMQRLKASCERLQINFTDTSRIESTLLTALSASSLTAPALTAKLVLTTGAGPRGYRRPAVAEESLFVAIDAARPLATQAYRHGVRARLCDTRLAIQPRLAGIKSLSRLEQVLARQEWRDPDVWEGVMLDTEDKLICGTMSNVFIVADNQYLTPRLDGCGVAGVMRQHVINLLAAAGHECDEAALTVADLLNADEVFLSNSQVGAVPVAALDTQTYSAGPATRRVQSLLAAAGVPECHP